MKTLRNRISETYRDRGSKFLGFGFPIDSQKGFGQELDKLKSEYPDASHHCYAWRINPANIEEFCTDDGEPGGTAGLPILNQLKSCEAVNAGIVVVRYFGGTKLGKSGLIEAYGHTAGLCLSHAMLQTITPVWEIEISYPYSEQNIIDELKYRFELKELDARYLADVCLTLACPVEKKEKLRSALQRLAHRGVEGTFKQKTFI